MPAAAAQDARSTVAGSATEFAKKANMWRQNRIWCSTRVEKPSGDGSSPCQTKILASNRPLPEEGARDRLIFVHGRFSWEKKT